MGFLIRVGKDTANLFSAILYFTIVFSPLTFAFVKK